MIDKDLAAFLQEGVGIHIATRNAALQPNGIRALAVTVESDGLHVVVYAARGRGGARAAGSRGQRRRSRSDSAVRSTTAPARSRGS